MRTRIEAACGSTPHRFLRRPSSVALAAEAGRDALEASSGAERIDLVVNVGVYRDRHICEPAVAPLIQRRIPSLAQRTDVFALDLANGACGLVQALQVVDSFVRAGSVRRALIVASDVDPDSPRSYGLSLRPAGAGVVAGVGDGTEGFLAFHSETFPEHADLYETRLDWVGRRGWLPGRSGHALAGRIGPSYAERCAASAGASAKRFLAAQRLGIDDLDLVVTADDPDGFAGALTAELGLDRARVITDPASAGTHSAAPGLALAAAITSGRLHAARRALLVAAGAGITVALALYGRRETSHGT